MNITLTSLSLVLLALPLAAAISSNNGSRRAGSRIAAGDSHACAVRGGGGVRCWGQNTYGQIGDNTGLQRLTPVEVVDLTNAIAIAAGSNHTCIINAGGSVRCWGRNNERQLGDNTQSDRFAPVNALGISDAIRIAAGEAHTCAVLVSGQVRCWGRGVTGQLGNGAAASNGVPVTVIRTNGNPLDKVVDIAAGRQHTCALTVNANVFCWGDNSDGQVASSSASAYETRATQVASTGNAILLTAGRKHTCIVRADRQLRCWGDNVAGQLGNNSYADAYAAVSVASGAYDVTGISAGYEHTCLLRANASVECWGSNANGELGDGTWTSRPLPGVASLNLPAAVALAASPFGRFGCALLADDRVRCWGNNVVGTLGDGTQTNRNTPVDTLGAGGSKARVISSDDYLTCAIRASGIPDCWGDNFHGQLGDGSYAQRLSPNPALPVSGLSSIVQIATAGSHACALEANGTVRCWGGNPHGELGNGTIGGNSTTPVIVSSLSDAIAIAVGSYYSCAVRVGGGVKCWGRVNGANTATPVNYGGFSDAVAIRLDSELGCVLRSGGGASCWDAAVSGAPFALNGVTDAVDVDAGGGFVCVVRAGGSVQCTGSNTYGQFGNGTYASDLTFSVMATASGLSNAVSISLGGHHSCAVLSNGSVKCWGNNYSGELGIGSLGGNRNTPTAVAGLDGVLQIDWSSAAAASGIPYTWGPNSTGRVGDSTEADRASPFAVPTF